MQNALQKKYLKSLRWYVNDTWVPLNSVIMKILRNPL